MLEKMSPYVFCGTDMVRDSRPNILVPAAGINVIARIVVWFGERSMTDTVPLEDSKIAQTSFPLAETVRFTEALEEGVVVRVRLDAIHV